MERRSSKEDLAGLASLSLINPWHAAMKLLDSAAEDEEPDYAPEMEYQPELEPRVASVRSRVFPLRNLFLASRF